MFKIAIVAVVLAGAVYLYTKYKASVVAAADAAEAAVAVDVADVKADVKSVEAKL